MLTRGDPGKAFVHSSCGDRRCCNPAHLELGRPGHRGPPAYETRGSLAEALLAQLDRAGGPTSCWLWTGRVTAQGYGELTVGPGRQRLAHRVAWQLARGDPAGGIVRHRCRRRRCCNPAHLRLVAVRADARRAPDSPVATSRPSTPGPLGAIGGVVEEYRPAWHADAACRTHPPQWWYPRRGQSLARAREICATCAVRVTCLEYALEHREEFGIWGGLSENQRRRLIAKAVPAAPAPLWAASA
jgi:WhiB family redox-sensing transcriptional regulator